MYTAQKGDIGEQAVILQALRRGWGVLEPKGNNLPYDLVFDISGKLCKIQVKQAWMDEKSQNYVVDNRRTKTNRRQMVREGYSTTDFDFAVVCIPDSELFYIFPVDVFISFASQISMVEAERRQRKPRSAAYRGNWQLIEDWAVQEETPVRLPLKVGETSAVATPSQACLQEGVET